MLVAALAAFALIIAAWSDDKTSTGTGASSSGAKAGAGKKVGLVFDIGGRGDKSFNDSAAAGLDQAKADFGIDTKDLSPAQGGQNREELLRLLTTDGYPLVFAIGFAFADGVKATAGDNPNTQYAIVDDASLACDTATASPSSAPTILRIASSSSSSVLRSSPCGSTTSVTSIVRVSSSTSWKAPSSPA